MGRDIRRRSWAGGLLLALTGGLLSAPASASVGWDDGALVHPEQTDHEERRAQVVVDSSGDRHVVWDDTNADVWLGEVAADGTVGAPVRLFDSDDDRAGGYPRLAIDDQDRITVVWYVTDWSLEGARAHVRSRTVSADGVLGQTQVLSDLSENAYYPEIAVDSAGVATVVWENQIGGGWPGRIEAVRLTPGTGTPEGPVFALDDPSGEGEAIGIVDATVAMDSSDRAVVAWTRFDGAQDGSSRNSTVRAVRLSAEGVPGEIRAVSDDPAVDFRYPQIAVAPDGTATIVTTRFGAVAGTVATRFEPQDFTPGPLVLLSHPERETWDDAAVTVDGLGRVTVAWFSAGRAGDRVETRRIGADGQPESRRKPVGRKGGISARFELIALTSDDEGRVTVAWPGADGRATRMHAVQLTPSGERSTTRRLSSRGGSEAFTEVIDSAIDARGRVSVVWSRYGKTAVRRSSASASEPVPADTTLLRGPRDGKVAKDRTPRFRFEADTLQATFQCRVDDRRWKACSSPFTTPKLTKGRHRVAVRAVDADGTPPDRTPVVARFRVR